MTSPSVQRAAPPLRGLFLGAAVAAALSLAACGQKDVPAGARGGGAGGGAPPPPEVAVVTVQPATVGLTTDLPGRLEPSRVAQVRARATGILQKRVFAEGSDVRAGQVLYQIDAAPYQATQQAAQAQLAQAQASLAQARANLAQASATVGRYRPLVAANAVSKQEFDAALTAEKAAMAAEKAGLAQVAAGRAAVSSASINVGYATVTAPISGRIGRSLVTEGALVSATEGTQLAVIQQINPLYLNVTQSAIDAMQLRQALHSGKLARAGGAHAAKVQVLLENGQVYDQTARLLFTDLTVDPATGQVSLRAEVPNPAGLLLPGMYVRARVEQAQVENAMLLPQQAVTRGSKGDTVLVVAPDGSVAPRPVKISGAQGHQWIVSDGLKPGEQVMVEGAMKLMMGAKVVKAVPWDPNRPAVQSQRASSAPQSGASGAPVAASAPAAAASR